jgi:hypothetical protein
MNEFVAVLVGFLGSPDWEIKIKQSVDRACMVEKFACPIYFISACTYEVIDMPSVPVRTHLGL